MALAYLMSNLIKESPDSDGLNRVFAMIVDHNARPDSRKEAEKVMSWLTDMGIEASIDTLDWDGDDPQTISNFETEARKKRYRQLAVSARSRHIHHLCTAHHMDDQVETLLMRLVRGENPSLLSFQGMRQMSAMPECEGFRGIRNAEPSVPLGSILRNSSPQSSHQASYSEVLQHTQIGQALYTLNDNIQGLVHGGIRLHRPLITFSKADLIATCEVNKIPYIKDKTNFDPTFTRRNAIRTLRSEHKLPRALQAAPLLSVMDKSRMTLASVQDRAALFLRAVSIVLFDFRSGVAAVRIPTSFLALCKMDQLAAGHVMVRLARLVSSVPADAEDTIASSAAIKALVAGMQSSFWEKPSTITAPRFNCTSVYFEALPLPPDMGQGTTLWRLSRQPMALSTRKTTARQFQLLLQTNGDTYSRWLLWDYRFWIRLRPSREDMLRFIELRAYSEDDVSGLKSKMPEKNWHELHAALHSCAPGKARYTLPVLTLNNQIIAFPTLFTQMITPDVYSENAKMLDLGNNPPLYWEVAYKMLPKDVSRWGTRVGHSVLDLTGKSARSDEWSTEERSAPIALDDEATRLGWANSSSFEDIDDPIAHLPRGSRSALNEYPPNALAYLPYGPFG